jgi:hypothetical protein
VQHHQPYGELASLPQPDRPWQEVTMDFITGFFFIIFIHSLSTWNL